jgi:hypothetical protein
VSDVISWLLNSDPVVRFQTKRDLLDLPKSEWSIDQKSAKTEGWVLQLMNLQDEDGMWSNGLYNPKFISTHYTLLLLRRFEITSNDNIRKGCEHLSKLKDICKPDAKAKRQDPCITGMGLSIIAHFMENEELFEQILLYLADVQLSDGGWNCNYPREMTNHSSLNTTISVLEGLTYLKRNSSKFASWTSDLQQKANEFLLKHQLYKSHTTGEIISPKFADITFPPRWRYNILSALDYFQMNKTPYDERMEDALEIIRDKEMKGRWNSGKQLAGKIFFPLNESRKPSPFNTLRALRVLKLYDQNFYNSIVK